MYHPDDFRLQGMDRRYITYDGFEWQLMNQSKPSIGYGTHGEFRRLLNCNRTDLTDIIRNGQGAGRVRIGRKLNQNIYDYELDLYYARDYLRDRGGAGGF
jgi:hypothetical protein